MTGQTFSAGQTFSTGQTFSANRPAREGALLERPRPDWLFLVAII
jgi:hypothetical protein